MKLLTLSALALAAPLLAHHSLKAGYDDSQLVTLSGTIVSTEWRNPHAKLVLTVEGVNWEIEFGAPNNLKQTGELRRDMLPQGGQIKVEVWVAKDGGHTAAARTITFPDGRSVSPRSMWDNPVVTGAAK